MSSNKKTDFSADIGRKKPIPRATLLVPLISMLISYFFVTRMGAIGPLVLCGGLLGVIAVGLLVVRYPVAVCLIWFVSMSGFHTLVMVRMPGMPDFSFPRLFLVLIIIMLPVGLILGRNFLRPPFLPDILLVMLTFYVLGNMYIIGDNTRFATWLASSLAPMIAYFFAKQYVQTEKQLRNVFISLIAITVYFWITSVGERFEVDSIVWPKHILDTSVGKTWRGRSRGPFLQPALFGQILGMYLLVHLFFLSRKISRFWRTLCLANFCLGAVGLLFTYTRGGWLAMVAGLISMGLLRPSYRKILITIGVLSLVFMTTSVMDSGSDEFLTTRMSNTSTIENRLGFLAAASRMLEESPLFGIGYFRYMELQHLYNHGTNIPLYGYVSKQSGVNVPIHDIYIGRAAEEGLISLFLFLSFWGAITLVYIKRWREDSQGLWFNRDSLALMAGISVAYLVGGMIIDYRYFDLINVLPMFFAGVVVGFPPKKYNSPKKGFVESNPIQ